MSQPSLGGIGDRDEEGTPPVSPIFVSEGTSGAATSTGKPKQGLFTQKSAPTFSRKYQDSSLDADDTESELVAIPESDLSESTIHNSSAPGSFDDPHSGAQFVWGCGDGAPHVFREAAKKSDEYHIEEIVQPLRSDQLKGKVTTANLATAQVALTTLGVAERERTEQVRTQFTFTFTNFLYYEYTVYLTYTLFISFRPHTEIRNEEDVTTVHETQQFG